MPAETVLGTLADAARDASRGVAAFLLCSEEVLLGGQLGSRDSRLNSAIVDPATLLSAVGHNWSQGRTDLHSHATQDWFKGDFEQFEIRLARLVARSWSKMLLPTTARRRPDVLGLTCELLANPQIPHTYSVVRFVITLCLRSAYKIAYEQQSLELLRAAYDNMTRRFQLKARRELKTATPHESFLLDLLAMEGWVHRTLTGENLSAYYKGFQYPFGVNPVSRRREFAESQDWPQLRPTVQSQPRPQRTFEVVEEEPFKRVPDFATVLNLAFAQPLLIPGFDEVTGGLIPTVAPPESKGTGGVVTLVAGPPGSGKTTLCVSIAARMAEMGSAVTFITTEEDPNSLRTKVSSTLEPRVTSLWPDYKIKTNIAEQRIAFRDGNEYADFSSLTEQIKTDFQYSSADTSVERLEQEPLAEAIDLYLVFPLVLVIDSVATLFQFAGDRPEWSEPSSQPRTGKAIRRNLDQLLGELRRLGVCVFLVGGQEDAGDHGLAYLVDNVFTVGFGKNHESFERHPTRLFIVEKTRLQTSHRGRHVFHISRRRGCAVSPSLHSTLRDLKGRQLATSDPSARAVLWSRHPGYLKNAFLPELRRPSEPITLRSRSHILVHGRGSAAKARFALAVALEPRIPTAPAEQWRTYVEIHSEPERQVLEAEEVALDRSRILIVSFLYGEQYYVDIATSILGRRHRAKKVQRFDARNHVTVLDFYPGYVDPETLVDSVSRQIHGAKLEGRPFTGVVVDGIHNLLLQFPLLEKEPLLWPTLYRLFKSEGLDAISTFTFFRVATLGRPADFEVPRQPPEFQSQRRRQTSDVALQGPERLFFHLLASSCDYTLLVEHPGQIIDGVDRDWIRVRLVSTVDGFRGEPEEFWWDPDSLAYRQEP